VFLINRRSAAREIIQAGMDSGEFRRDVDIELIIDLIYGPMWYRLMVGHQPLNREFAETFSRLAIAALRPESR